MSIARPCPYSEDKEFCKYEKYMGEPNTKMCEKCSRRVPKPEPPKLEMVKEDFNPIKALQMPHSVHSIKAKWENYTASYINDDQMATILMKFEAKRAQFNKEFTELLKKYHFSLGDFDSYFVSLIDDNTNKSFNFLEYGQGAKVILSEY